MTTTNSDAFTKAISAFTERMVEFSKITRSIEGLNEAVEKLTQAVDALPKADQDGEIVENGRTEIEEETAWELVRDTTKDQEKETIESWKDELNNLLVFAGLFSAVVTAFTTESYTWLKQDPGDNVSSSSVAHAVPVNTLWVLSLTLSLISAFFAIAAQQWLRQLRLPPEMPVRRAVQLLAIRSDGLKTWQVPSIISLLPLLLQVAVIFFLVGLLLLLQSLNATVTVAFGVVALIGLLAFLATIVIPLITPHCPYKSPLVPTVVIAFQCLSYPLAVALIPVMFVTAMLLSSPPGQLIVCRLPGRGFYIDRDVKHFLVDTLLPYVKFFGRHIFVDIAQFWLSREYKYILSRDEHDKVRLEQSSLIQILLSIPSRNCSRVSQLVRSFGGDMWLRTFQSAVVQGLRVFRNGLEWNDLFPKYTYASEPTMMPYIDGWLSVRDCRLLWHHFYQQDSKQWDSLTSDRGQALILAHGASSVAPQRYAKHLIHICSNQRFSQFCYSRETIPACLMLDLILNRNYVPDELDVVKILGFNSKVYGEHHQFSHDRRRICLVSTALTLITIHRSGYPANMINTVNMLSGILDENGTKETAISEIQWYYRIVNGWAQVYPEVMSPARVFAALCDALNDYVSTPLLSCSPAHLHALNRVSNTLRTICGDPAYGTKPEMREACDRLVELDYALASTTVEELVPATAINSSDGEPSSHRKDHAVIIPLQVTGPDDILTSTSALTTGAVSLARADNSGSTKAVYTQDKRDHSALSSSPPVRNKMDGHPAAFGSSAVTSPARYKGKSRETHSIPLPTSKPQEAQVIQNADASSPGSDGVAPRGYGPGAPSASNTSSVAADDDIPLDKGDDDLDTGEAGGHAVHSDMNNGE